MVQNIYCVYSHQWGLASSNDASLLTGTECCERLAYYGIACNLVTYLKMKLHQGNLEAARNVATWGGTCYLTPLIGAILADSYWGKYWTIAVFSSVYFIVSTRWCNPNFSLPPLFQNAPFWHSELTSTFYLVILFVYFEVWIQYGSCHIQIDF
jgi:hypothetical protein